ncbi:NAD(P)-dependent oxidoreductase [Tenacibaculum sp.]|uniref:NAD(P)-dependent oxidoreductase n=1 Tax=Tenacibaculum sp. TaxID=1906242 RepID=UPI003D0E4613
MKIIVFGATGSVGMEIVKQALKQGHEVTAFVRNPNKLQVEKSSNLQLFKGDIANAESVKKAVQNQEAVLCAIGDGKVGEIRDIGTKNIVEAMEKTNVKRLICQTTLGMGDSYNNLNFIWKHIMFGFLLKKAFHDHKLQEQHILNSDLNYTIVRPSAFTDGGITQNYKKGFDGSFKKLNLKISRADVAYCMLEVLNKNKSIKEAISISN